MADVDDLIAGRYRLVNRIAVGGMGVVWEGWDELLARKVAVKQLLTQPGLSDADALLARNRVIREARITARLHHPQAVTIYDVVDDGDAPCLIMQFVPSDSLNTVLREHQTLLPGRVGRIGADLAAALQAAHSVGIVHRDVKPGNVLIAGDGSAKLTDFGISHAVGDVTLTSTGMVSGTPAYLAPEVARGGESGFAADVFSLGATLYACTEGTPPFGADANPMAVLHRVASGQMIPPRRSGPMTPLLLQMMASEPADRPSMSQVYRTLTFPQLDVPAAPVRAPERPAVRTTPVTRSNLSAALQAEPTIDPAPETGGRPSVVGPIRPNSGELPPQSDGDRRRRTGVLLAVATVVVAVSLVVGFLLVRSGDSGQTSATTTAAQTLAEATPEPATAMSAAQTSPPSSDPTTAGSTEPVTGEPTAAQLSAAVSDYYALMPANTDAGWSRLTPDFQTGIARDREYYNSFWGGVAQVAVSDVTGTPPDTAEATITYTFTDGSVSVERTSFTLASDDGTLKIDNSSVITSRSG